MSARASCPDCGRLVAVTSRGIAYRHGSPPCPRSKHPVGRLWPTRYRGRRVQTIPGPDTWNPTTLEGAA